MKQPWEDGEEAAANTDVIAVQYDANGNPLRRFPKPTFGVPEQREAEDG